MATDKIKKGLPDAGILGLIDEIQDQRARSRGMAIEADSATARLLHVLQYKIETGIALTGTEKEKIEGIYAYMCR
jgi:hypothetical protein